MYALTTCKLLWEILQRYASPPRCNEVLVMTRFGKSVVYGGFFAFWIMCFYFGFGVFATLFKGDDVVAFAGQSVIVGFVLWFAFGYGFYELNGMIEERNKPRDFDRQAKTTDSDETISPSDDSRADRH